MTDIHGSVAAGFEPVREAFERNFTEHGEVGASFAVRRGDEILVDVWGGYADAEKSRRWEADTITTVYSTTKGMAALVLAMLADRGELDYNARVTDYWPEFGDNGKEAVLVRELLSHQAGLCGWKEPMTVDDLYDWEKSTSMLAAQAPLWPPGTKNGYHAMTFGHLAGEIVRRITGVSIGQWFHEQVAAPLNADFFIGLPESEEGRVAEMIPARTSGGARARDPSRMNEAMKLAFGNPTLGRGTHNTRAWRAAEIPAANGQGNGRGLATIYGVLAAGGGELLSADGIAAATTVECERPDEVLVFAMRWSRGFIINNTATRSGRGIYGPNVRSFGHSGAGGSFGFADPDSRLGIGYVMNQMQQNLQGDPRSLALIDAVYDCL